ncbi:haloalkane dehalogenase [Streptomyces sp. SID13031]|uniref:haloalkane dehalogenase n=1 Tax=Streptomyces sp. SID13031 TaxID=2706046 RepID=UPI0013C9911E|nr:haloalkane dehalogenase [Streptomyces sp. SID13031]NEA31465.1 haloalkane dehalogenase [Streptomyces sp. SID13031]
MPTIDVLDSWIHYAETGLGEPVVFLHGNPTSSYLWRNVLEPVAKHGWRCIAPDLIGMGKSGRPDVDYRLADHIAYLGAFIEALGLDRFTLVGHDWGAVLALDRARRRPDQVRGVAFLEGHIHPITHWEDFDEDSRDLFQRLRNPDLAEPLILEQNLFIEKVLPSGVLRTLTTEELDAYRAPFLDPLDRRTMLAWPGEIPIEGEPADVTALVIANQAVIADPTIPKLLIHATPGAVIGPTEVDWCRTHGQNLTITHVGPGTHFLPEDRPTQIATALAGWLQPA